MPPGVAFCATSLSGELGRLTRHRHSSFDDFRSIEASTATALMPKPTLENAWHEAYHHA
jgi:hypothetical protein